MTIREYDFIIISKKYFICQDICIMHGYKILYYISMYTRNIMKGKNVRIVMFTCGQLKRSVFPNTRMQKNSTLWNLSASCGVHTEHLYTQTENVFLKYPIAVFLNHCVGTLALSRGQMVSIFFIHMHKMFPCTSRVQYISVHTYVIGL